MTTETSLKSVTRDGVSIRYTDAGAGDPPILFVHGWTCNHTNFRDQVPHFAGSHRVVALDQRGHGTSDKPDQDYTIPSFVDDLAWFIREAGLDRPVIVGHSMGGSIALNFAHKHPEMTRGIVLIDSPVVPLPAALAPVLEQTLAAFKSPAYLAAQEGFARMQFFNANTSPALIEELLASMCQAPQRLVHTAIESILAPNRCRRVRSLSRRCSFEQQPRTPARLSSRTATPEWRCARLMLLTSCRWRSPPRPTP